VGLGYTAVTVSKAGVVGFEAVLDGALSGPRHGSLAAQRGVILIPIPTRPKVGPGQHVRVNENINPKAEAYQKQVADTGKDEAYYLNGVKFDGIDNGVLVDAKHGYENFVKNGEFVDWWAKGLSDIINQAERQVRAADGFPIQWRFSHKEVADAFRKRFKNDGIEIEVMHVPVKESK